MSTLTQETIFSKQDFSTVTVSSPPRYDYSKITPTIGATLSATNTGISDVTMVIPTTAFNPAKSYFSCTMTHTLPIATAANAGHLIACNQDAFPLIEGIHLVTTSGQPLINKMQNVRQYLKVMNPRQTSMKEYLQADPSTLFYPSDKLAATTGNITFATTGALTSASSTNYIENNHVFRGTAAVAADAGAGIAAADGVLSMRGITLPFSALKNTFLALDKTVIFPENLELTFQFGYTGHSFVDITVADGTATAFTGTITITEMTLYLCVEENADNVKMLQVQIATNGLKIHMPVVEISTSLGTTTSQQGTIQISKAKGSRLRKIYVAPFQTTITAGAGQYLDNSNINGSKITRYLLQFNNARRGNLDTVVYSATDACNMDWKEYRRKHPSGDDAIVSRDYFYYNYAILEEFDGGEPINNNSSAGEILTNLQYTFDYTLTTGNLGLTHHRFVIYEKDMLITDKTVIFN